MYKTATVLLVTSVCLSACSGWSNSRANPSNWFGRSTPAPSEFSVDDANALIPEQRDGGGLFSGPEVVDNSVAIGVIDELRIDPTATGAIIFASGTAVRQGAFNAQLARTVSDELAKDGIMEFTFRVEYPNYETAQGSERSRMVSDAITVSEQDLEGIRLVRVVGQRNALESRRR